MPTAEGGSDVGRLVLIGGGAARTAAALALHKAGFEITAFEAHRDAAEDPPAPGPAPAAGT
ncbi:hypothetical protein GCM10010234_49730 [Streptomyces hawaiiensis]